MMMLLSSDKKLKPVNYNNPVKFCGVFSAMIGLIYILNLPGLTGDATPTTVPWGWMGILLGIIILWAGMGALPSGGFRKLFLSIILGVITLLQILPITAWLLFNGEVISDGPVGPVGHWLWSVPHIILTLAAVYSLYRLLFKNNNV